MQSVADTLEQLGIAVHDAPYPAGGIHVRAGEDEWQAYITLAAKRDGHHITVGWHEVEGWEQHIPLDDLETEWAAESLALDTLAAPNDVARCVRQRAVQANS